MGLVAVDVADVGIDERLLRMRSNEVAMIAMAAIASITSPIGDVKSANIESGIGWTRNSTPWRTVAFLTLVQVAEFEVVLVGEGVPAGTTTFT